MYPIILKDNEYYFANIKILDIAKKYKTPSYVYDLDLVTHKYNTIKNIFTWPKIKICYAMKANSNLDILKTLKDNGASIDAVSYGDVLVAKKIGFQSKDILYTANNASDEEIELVHNSKVLINIGDISRIEKFGKKHPKSRICLRFNTEVESGENDLVKTSGEDSQFGIRLEDINEAILLAKKYELKIIGIHEHTGSGLVDTKDMFESINRTLNVAKRFSNLEFINFGGGFKVNYYPNEKDIDYRLFGEKISAIFKKFCSEYGKKLELIFEPGKYIVAEAGIMLVEVNTLKKTSNKIYAGIDSGFSQLIRPTLYNAYHHIINCSNPQGKLKKYSIAGNICEGGDLFAKDRLIEEIREKDILIIQHSGAYGFCMASTYNNRPLPAEIVIQNGKYNISRNRMSFEEFVKKKYP
ncbi:MAG: diaminopimelate decarboxylase [Candidatus Woesearchaeota archaeon]